MGGAFRDMMRAAAGRPPYREESQKTTLDKNINPSNKKKDMKKLYFTKYLPVEREIKDGDLYQKEYGDRYNYLAYQNYKPEGKFLKLFLCSQDIKVGDKINHTLHGERIYTQDEADDFGLHTYLDKGWFKVVGEISPDALGYVKEGQEFDEDEVRWKYNNEWLPITHWLPNSMKIVQIKGSCGFYH